jgi:hypothetical protein
MQLRRQINAEGARNDLKKKQKKPTPTGPFLGIQG